MQDLIKKYQGYQLGVERQTQLNSPLKDDTGFNEGHEEFLKMLVDKVNSGLIVTTSPKTLYNQDIYQKLTEEQQEKADLTAINLMSLIRQIEALWKIDQNATFQIQNLVEAVFQMKSKFEKDYGDVYII